MKRSVLCIFIIILCVSLFPTTGLTEITEKQNRIRLTYSQLPTSGNTLKGESSKFEVGSDSIDIDYDSCQRFSIDMVKKDSGAAVGMGISYGLARWIQTEESYTTDIEAEEFKFGISFGFSSGTGLLSFELTPFGNLGLGKVTATENRSWAQESFESDWGLAWDAGLRGGVIFTTGHLEFGINVGYMISRLNFAYDDEDANTYDYSDDVNYTLSSDGPIFGVSLGVAF